MEIFIGNIPYETTADEVEGLLAPHGRVDRLHLPVSASGQPRGFAFATMPVRAQAAAAVAALDGTRFRGRLLRVNEATDRNHRRSRDGRNGRTRNAPSRQGGPPLSAQPGAGGVRRNPQQNPIPPHPVGTGSGPGTKVDPGRHHTRGAVMVAAAFSLVLGASVVLKLISPPIVAAYVLLSLLTYVVYAVDKHSARAGHWRTAESTLHLLALVGGWPGASLARHRLRHKTVKQPFRTVFVVTILLNCAGFAWLFTADGVSAQQGLDSLIATYASLLD